MRTRLLGILRIFFGFIFLWAFIDKLFGLGFATAKEKAWILGVSPTYGFLSNSSGPLKGFYALLAGNTFVDWLFMLGLLLIGIALMLGIGTRISYYSGFLLMLLMWGAALPPRHNPIIDEHIIYAVVFLIMLRLETGRYFGLGNWWMNTKLVKRYKFLE